MLLPHQEWVSDKEITLIFTLKGLVACIVLSAAIIQIWAIIIWTSNTTNLCHFPHLPKPLHVFGMCVLLSIHKRHVIAAFGVMCFVFSCCTADPVVELLRKISPVIVCKTMFRSLVKDRSNAIFYIGVVFQWSKLEAASTCSLQCVTPLSGELGFIYEVRSNKILQIKWSLQQGIILLKKCNCVHWPSGRY